MKDPVNIVKFAAALVKRPKGRACVVLTRDWQGQKAWAKDLAAQAGTQHLDLLDHFAGHTALAAKVSEFSVDHLFDFLKNITASPLAIVTGIEFLKATWSGQPSAEEDFARHLETWESRPALLFLLQHSNALADYKFSSRLQGYTFVIAQKDTLALS
jgi:hypothetical protein